MTTDLHTQFRFLPPSKSLRMQHVNKRCWEEMAFESTATVLDFDSTIPRFESWRPSQ